jgi:hypothetical protein
MTSFIDLMASHRWSDTDITNRTEAMLRSEFSAVEEQILNRDFTAALSGLAPMTPELQERAMAFKAAAENARLAGVQARADMALLEEVLALEAAQARLARPVVEAVLSEPDEHGVQEATNQAEFDADVLERAAAQEVVDAASVEAKDLALRRAPIPEPAPPEPEPPINEEMSQ